MKRIISALLVGFLLVVSLSVNAFAYRAEWDAEIFDDDNYNLFGEEGSVEFAPDAAVDAVLESGWQKQADVMDAQGYIEREYFIAMEWEDAIVVEAINIWWRSSTRAFASTEGYVVQIGTKSGNSYRWTDADVTYSYNSKTEENGRFACDKITFKKKTELTCFRILIKRGMDYERGYSPKVNEIELTAEQKQEILPPPVSSESPVSSEPPVSSKETVSSEAPESSEEASSDTSSEVSSEEPEDVSSAPTVNTSSENTSSQVQTGGQGESENLTPWLVLSAVSLLVIAACAVLLIGNSKKSQ